MYLTLGSSLKVKIVGQWWRTPSILALGTEAGFLKRYRKHFLLLRSWESFRTLKVSKLELMKTLATLLVLSKILLEHN